MTTNEDGAPIAEIVGYWLGDGQTGPEAAFARRDWWYRGGEAVDREIRDRFGEFIQAACDGGLSSWEETGEGSLALVLLLDQFTRNIWRNTPEAYAGDARAYEVVSHAIGRGLDRELHPVSRIWLYHPFHHSERIADQDRGLALLHDILRVAPEDWHAYVGRSVTGWTRHRDIVARFGRFPHRNAVLGRDSTAEEEAFMADAGESFGQGPKQAAD